MKKKVLLIGNNHGLTGVQKDFVNYKSFFTSAVGGHWFDSEIIERMNPKKIDLKNELSSLKNESLDFLIIMFSGHGGQEREVVLELNENNETIYESELKNIAPRQITIYDCCRAISPSLQFSEGRDILKKAVAVSTKIRESYEMRIMQAVHQQVNLYACSIGEYARDTGSGGIYSKNLIIAAKAVVGDFMSVGRAHQIASELTKKEETNQNPDATMIKCRSFEELVISINPNIK